MVQRHALGKMFVWADFMSIMVTLKICLHKIANVAEGRAMMF